MRILATTLCIAALALPAHAAELTLNDLPSVLKKLRGCTEVPGIFGASSSCRVDSSDLWASVDSEGKITLFRKRSYGDMTYASGRNVGEMLRDFAAKINNDQAANKSMLEAMAPLLPTQ